MKITLESAEVALKANPRSTMGVLTVRQEGNNVMNSKAWQEHMYTNTVNFFSFGFVVNRLFSQIVSHCSFSFLSALGWIGLEWSQSDNLLVSIILLLLKVPYSTYGKKKKKTNKTTIKLESGSKLNPF